MTDTMAWLAVAAWYASGVWSHIYWLRNQYDYETKDVPTSLFTGLVGPFAFWVGWTVYGDAPKSKSKPLLRKRP